MHIWRTIIGVVFLALVISIKSFYSIDKEPAIVYVPYLPNEMMSIPIPPAGIFVHSKFKGQDVEAEILAHDFGHWKQYQERGVWEFYLQYFVAVVEDGWVNNSFEKEISKVSDG